MKKQVPTSEVFTNIKLANLKAHNKSHHANLSFSILSSYAVLCENLFILMCDLTDDDHGAWLSVPGLSTWKLSAPEVHRETCRDHNGGGRRKTGQRERDG